MRRHQEIVSEIFGTDKTVSLPAASRENLADCLRAADGFALVHFGCHGVFNPEDPLASALQLSSGKESANWYATDFLQTPCPADLVVLAACDTGMNATRPGDELIGLTRSILYAGARSVLVSLWPVDQSSTALLLDALYRELGRHANKAEALRAAQLAVRELTAEQILLDCQGQLARLAGTGPAEVDARLRLRVIRAREAAGDHEEALRECSQLAATVGPADPLAPEVRRIAARCRRAMRFPQRPDYQVRPYADPLYWAAFVLIGDWN
jgi:CHAT domain-containing protein